MIHAFIGVGSNLKADENIRKAAHLLAGYVEIVQSSTFYRTPAETRADQRLARQPDYINGVLVIATEPPCEELKQNVLRPIEGLLGRQRGEDKFASRPMDLDLLFCVPRDTPELELHCTVENIIDRAFVAIPLAELVPDLRLPGTGLCMREIAAHLSTAAMLPLAGLSEDLRRICTGMRGADERL